MSQEANQDRRPAAGYVVIALFAITVAALCTIMLTTGL